MVDLIWPMVMPVKAVCLPAQEFLQAVDEVLTTLDPVLKKRPELVPILEKLCEPERQIMFRVPWCVCGLRQACILTCNALTWRCAQVR